MTGLDGWYSYFNYLYHNCTNYTKSAGLLVQIGIVGTVH